MRVRTKNIKQPTIKVDQIDNNVNLPEQKIIVQQRTKPAFLAELEDVEIKQQDNDLLVYNSKLNKWVSINLSELLQQQPKEEVFTESQKEQAKRTIDAKAEQVRLRYITSGLGQALVYLEKAEEATDYAAAGYPDDLSSYPYIRADSIVYMIEPKEAADRILNARANWITKSAEIEQVRLAGKYDIDHSNEPLQEIVEATLAALDEL